MWVHRWIIEWREPGRRGETVTTAATPEEALAICRRFLENETTFDEWRDEDRPALEVLFDDEDPLTVLNEIDDCVKLECETGDFVIRRTLEFQEDEPARALHKAAPALLDFARLFLAYHDNQAPDDVTMRSLEDAARAAVAIAAGKPPTPLTLEGIEKLKQHYLEWTGGFPPADEHEIFTYLELAMQSGLDPEKVRAVLRRWLNEALQDELPADIPIVVGRQSNACSGTDLASF